MKTLTLKRISTNQEATFGVLIDDTEPFAVTLERPWAENRIHVSCIPSGIYTCARASSPRFGDTFEVLGVPERSEILFHKGNTPGDTAGCILVAERFERLRGEPAVLSSAGGYGEFMERMEGAEGFKLTIIWV